MTMMQHIERFLEMKRNLGYSHQKEEWHLRRYAEFADDHGDRFTRCDRMLECAARERSFEGAIRHRETLRKFSLWLSAEDERHEVLPRNAIGRRMRIRPTPSLLTPHQIERVMEAALAVPPVASINPYTFHFMIGLLAATGMRVSEATSLLFTDVTSDGLVIRETKFDKSRLVPLHLTARTALERYLEIRKLIGGANEHLFVLADGKPTTPGYISEIFRILARKVGIKDGPGTKGPTLHSLRHSFAVRSLETLNGKDRDTVSRHMLGLSTYLGHANVWSTYWYLEATPVLLKSISDAMERGYQRRVGQ